MVVYNKEKVTVDGAVKSFTVTDVGEDNLDIKVEFDDALITEGS